MALTEGQKACVETLDKPIAVSAGAGSGKTYTLTRRIVNALETGYLSSVDEVLAITFTTKAAGEIKSRIKSTLRAQGMVDEALKVDGAYISTIHRMCSRILHTHALELGLSPDFSVADDVKVKQLLDLALDETLGSDDALVSEDESLVGALFSEFTVRASRIGPDKSGPDNSVESMVRKLVTIGSASPDGMACIELPPRARSARVLAEELRGVAQKTISFVQEVKPGVRRDEFLASTAAALQALEHDATAFDQGLLLEFGYSELVALMNSFPFPMRGFGRNTVYAEHVEELQEGYSSLACEARQGLAETYLRSLMQLAQKVYDRFVGLKREDNVLDNNDLLTFVARALDNNPGIAAEYTKRFKLIMIDEFQDTDQLQVDMAKRLAYEGLTNLCTVGDAQQSIYRFRGADVSVYRRHLADVRSLNPKGLIKLDANFRSHASILEFSNKVFSQPSVFGGEYMSLEPGRDELRVAAPYKGSAPRVRVQLTTRPYKGVPSDESTRFAARRLARAFAQLKREGHPLGDMVLLLRAMTQANVYADAFREQGLACVIAGGSTFSTAPEVQLMLRLAEYIANPCWSNAAFEVVSSPLFALSADDLLRLGTGFNEELGIAKRRNITVGIEQLVSDPSDSSLSPALQHLVAVLQRMYSMEGRAKLSEIMQDVLLQSGWVARLESQGAEGLAVAGNIYKVLRMAQDIERNNAFGPSRVAKQLRSAVELSKESPSALSTTGGEFIRIMTVHASKGLEFPIVAVAELGEYKVPSDSLLQCSIKGRTYINLDGGQTLKDMKDEASSSIVAKSSEFKPFGDADEAELERYVAQSQNPACQREAIRAFEAAGESSEARRLLYVAITRAKEALIICANTRRSKDDPTGLGSSVVGDIQSALVGEGQFFPVGVSRYNYGYTETAEVERTDLNAGEGVEGEGAVHVAASGENAVSSGLAGSAAKIDLPQVGWPYSVFADSHYRMDRGNVFSYSSLHEFEPSSQPGPATATGAADGGSEDEVHGYLSEFTDKDDADWEEICDSLKDEDSATDFGTAFHRCAQYAVEMRAAAGRLTKPGDKAIGSIAYQMGLSDVRLTRLHDALDRWFGSSICARVDAYASVQAEVPFFAHVGPAAAGTPVADIPFLEGEIDLLASNGTPDALIIDYKTGGTPDETPAQLHDKHHLQGMCYAYALMKAGYESVEAVFVRVEQETEEGQPQTVAYHYSKADLAGIEAKILEVRALGA